jgi:hypothetical protein
LKGINEPTYKFLADIDSTNEPAYATRKVTRESLLQLKKTVKYFDDGDKCDVDLTMETMSLMEKFPVTFGEPCEDWGNAWNAREIVEGMTSVAITDRRSSYVRCCIGGRRGLYGFG